MVALKHLIILTLGLASKALATTGVLLRLSGSLPSHVCPLDPYNEEPPVFLPLPSKEAATNCDPNRTVYIWRGTEEDGDQVTAKVAGWYPGDDPHAPNPPRILTGDESVLRILGGNGATINWLIPNFF